MINEDLNRCKWVDVSSDIYREYHDCEWGVPVYDDDKLFEMLILESFQAGLSWLIILIKRKDFKIAFKNFDPVKIAGFDDQDVHELLSNEKIVRNKAKIDAAITNSKIFLDIQNEFGSFSDYIWGFTNHKIVKNSDDYIPTKTELSDRISKDMKKRGMKFLGSVTVYSYLQAVGIVDDHESSCYKNNGGQLS